MALTIRFRHTAHIVYMSLHNLLMAPHSRDANDVPATVSSRQRWQVIRRDRSRCRGCDRKGDEITLEVHPIAPGVSETDCLLALCPNCRALANAYQLKGASIPDFLRQLWRHLHHSTPETQAQQALMCTASEMTPARPSGERLARQTSYSAVNQRAPG